MSYDISVWNVSRALTKDEIKAVCDGVFSDEGTSSHLSTDSKVKNFITEIEGIYPQIDSYPEADIDSCPWSCGFDSSEGHVTLSCVWSRSEEISSLVFDLAMRHELAVFDFTTELLYLPPSLALRSESSMTSPWLLKDQPAYSQIIPDLLATLQKREDPYLVVESGDEKYIQTLWTKDGYLLEYRDGSPDSHFRASSYLDSAKVSKVICGYIDSKSWNEEVEFQKVKI